MDRMSDNVIQVEGVVAKKRKRQDALVLTVKLKDCGNWEAAASRAVEHVVAVFEKSNFKSEFLALFDLGTHVVLKGLPQQDTVSSQGQMLTLGVEKVEITRLSDKSGLNSIEKMIGAFKSGKVTTESFLRAIESDNPALATKLKSLDPTSEELKQEVIKISRRLKGLPDTWKRRRSPKVTNEDKELLMNLRSGRVSPLHELEPIQFSSCSTLDLDDKALPFHPLDPVQHLSVEDFDRRTDYVEKKKSPQIKWMLDCIRQLYIPSSASSSVDTQNTVFVDVGCGRGDLALNVAATFTEATVVAFDTNSTSVQAGKERALAQHLANISFWNVGVESVFDFIRNECSPLEGELKSSKIPYSVLEGLKNARSIIFLGLHACGGLSDAILALATKFPQGKVLCCTCCFTKHGDIRTEFCEPNLQSSLPTGKNEMAAPDQCTGFWWGLSEMEGKKMSQLCELHESVDLYQSAMQCINSLRLNWFNTQREAMKLPNRGKMTVRILTFPTSFSPKNQVLSIV